MNRKDKIDLSQIGDLSRFIDELSRKSPAEKRELARATARDLGLNIDELGLDHEKAWEEAEKWLNNYKGR